MPISEDKHTCEKKATLPTSRPACPPSFAFQQRPFRKETLIEYGVNEDAVAERSVEKSTQHRTVQNHQDVEHSDDSIYQSPRGAVTTRALANLGLREESEDATHGSELGPIGEVLEALQGYDKARIITTIYKLMRHETQLNENVHLYLQVEFTKMALLECDWQQRIVAIKAIGMWGGARSVSALKICLQHPYEYVRSAATQAVADIGVRADLGEKLGDAIFSLLLASSDRHWVVRAAAIQAMRMLGQRNVGRLEFVNAVILALDDEECMVRIAAVRALYHLKGRQALPRLALIAERDFEYLVRDAAQDVVHDGSLN